jgi:hypothetical protein
MLLHQQQSNDGCSENASNLDVSLHYPLSASRLRQALQLHCHWRGRRMPSQVAERVPACFSDMRFNGKEVY